MYIYVIIKSVAVIIIKKKKKGIIPIDSLDTVSPGEGKRKKKYLQIQFARRKKKKNLKAKEKNLTKSFCWARRTQFRYCPGFGSTCSRCVVLALFPKVQ